MSHPLHVAPYWQSVQEHLLHIVDLIPEDRLNRTPDAKLWNSRGILIHLADARDRWLATGVNDGDPYPNIWITARTKDDLRRELERTFTRLQRFLGNQKQLEASYPGPFREPGARNGHWIAFHLLEHDIHHRAELLQRLALMDISHGIDL